MENTLDKMHLVFLTAYCCMFPCKWFRDFAYLCLQVTISMGIQCSTLIQTPASLFLSSSLFTVSSVRAKCRWKICLLHVPTLASFVSIHVCCLLPKTCRKSHNSLISKTDLGVKTYVENYEQHYVQFSKEWSKAIQTFP